MVCEPSCIIHYSPLFPLVGPWQCRLTDVFYRYCIFTISVPRHLHSPHKPFLLPIWPPYFFVSFLCFSDNTVSGGIYSYIITSGAPHATENSTTILLRILALYLWTTLDSFSFVCRDMGKLPRCTFAYLYLWNSHCSSHLYLLVSLHFRI